MVLTPSELDQFLGTGSFYQSFVWKDDRLMEGDRKLFLIDLTHNYICAAVSAQVPGFSPFAWVTRTDRPFVEGLFSHRRADHYIPGSTDYIRISPGGFNEEIVFVRGLGRYNRYNMFYPIRM